MVKSMPTIPTTKLSFKAVRSVPNLMMSEDLMTDDGHKLLAFTTGMDSIHIVSADGTLAGFDGLTVIGTNVTAVALDWKDVVSKLIGNLLGGLAGGVGGSVRDEEAAGSNPATPTGKRQVTRHLVACRLHYAFPDVRFWGPVGSEHGNGGPLGPRLALSRCCDNYLYGFKAGRRAARAAASARTPPLSLPLPLRRRQRRADRAEWIVPV